MRTNKRNQDVDGAPAFWTDPSSRTDDGAAFVPDTVRDEGASVQEDESDSFGEEFIAAATGGQSIREEARDEVSDEEIGGPFVVLELEREQEENEEEAALTPRVAVPRARHSA